ncbi:transposable element Tc1 transposase [Trichonephila clavipes]|nr:transposable element Tc1 transposase [Trichonephila clavipes]
MDPQRTDFKEIDSYGKRSGSNCGVLIKKFSISNNNKEICYACFCFVELKSAKNGSYGIPLSRGWLRGILPAKPKISSTPQLNDGASRTVSKRTVKRSLHRVGYGSRRPTRVPLLNVRHRAACLAWARKHSDWSVEDWKRVAWSDESRFRLLNAHGRLRIWSQGSCIPVFQQEDCTSDKSRLATGWLDEHSSDFFVINWPSRSPDLNPTEHLWVVLEQGMKRHHTAPTNFTELLTALANI